jgi:hypothetical protein
MALGACSAASDASGGRRTPNGISGGGTGGAGGGSGASGVGGIDQPGMAMNFGGGGAGGEAASMCQEGVFCPPTTPDGTDCGSLRLESDVTVTTTPGNLLIVFDQSGSMNDDWGATTKADAAIKALAGALAPLQDSLTVGALFFPTFACVPFFPPPEGGAVAPIESPDQISFRAGPEFITAWNERWALLGNRGNGIGTPLNEAMDRAAAAIQNASMTLTGATAVVVFTDGEPNCFSDAALSGTPTMLETAWAAQWLGSGIKTYVVGLPGADAAPVLNDIAVSGGTTSYITPDDPAVLEAKLAEVVQSTVTSGFNSCVLALNPVADLPDKLHIVVEEPAVPGKQDVPRDLGNGAGWSISSDGATVELLGQLCDDAKAGRFTAVTFEYGCVELPPLEIEPPD